MGCSFPAKISSRIYFFLAYFHLCEVFLRTNGEPLRRGRLYSVDRSAATITS